MQDPEGITCPVEFIITGFGPFQNARENPSTSLANEIVAYLQENSSSVFIRETRIIETSADSARQEVADLYRNNDVGLSSIVVLHIGVNYRGKKFQLEKCAYNDATFRIPDENGYQPKGETVCDHYEWGTLLKSTLDLPIIVSTLNDWMESKSNPARAICSENPGRFVCNFTYFCSLDRCTSDNRGKFHCLFLHIPPFSEVKKEFQLSFLSQLLNEIQLQIVEKSMTNE